MGNKKVTLLALAPLLAIFLLGMASLGAKKSFRISPIERGWLGASIKDLDYDMLEALGLKDKRGIMVVEVHPKGPADKAGLEEEDIIVEFNGREIDDCDELRRLVRRTKPGEIAKIVVLRKGKEQEFDVKIGRRKLYRSFDFKAFPGFHFYIGKRGVLGLKVQDLNPELARYFQVKDAKGVLVLEVREDSASEKAGFLPGDVIRQLGDERVDDIEGLCEILEEVDEREELTFEILRQGKKRVLTAKVESRYHPYYFYPHIFDWLGEMEFPSCEYSIHIPEIKLPKIEIPEIEIPEIDLDLKAQDLELDKLQRELERMNRSLKREILIKLRREESKKRLLRNKLQKKLLKLQHIICQRLKCLNPVSKPRVLQPAPTLRIKHI